MASLEDIKLIADDNLHLGYSGRQSEIKPMISIQKQSLIFYSILAAVVAMGIGVLMGLYGVNIMITYNLLQAVDSGDKSTLLHYNEALRIEVQGELKAINIKNYLKKLTEKPHLAGSHQDEKVLVELVKDRFLKDLDYVEVIPYSVLLSFPNQSNPNYLAFVSPNGSLTFQTKSKEPALVESEEANDVVDGFNSYSPAGHVQGDLFYVNYARVVDFQQLQNMHVDVSNAICIARYGKLFRGDKVTNAHHYNCSALVLFSDPADYGGVDVHGWSVDTDNPTYPDSWWLPPSGFQRGSLYMGGDPETPFYPSLNITYREKNNIRLPHIPVQPISYVDAYNYFSRLGGVTAPRTWQGGFNLTYSIGGIFKAPFGDFKVQLHVGNVMQRKTIHNVIGYVYGTIEPDRYVLFGNHRDAWEFGGADPSSGTAVLLESSRAIGVLLRRGSWRPRRTILFCSWGAEEYGLIGSTEWVEQVEKRLLLRAVAYVNIDIAVQGNATFRASATPTLYGLLYNTTQSVSNPDPLEVDANRTSVYDTWLHKLPDTDNPTRPFIRNLGSGSDYTMFVQRTGVASIDMRYTFDQHNLSSYPVYHSLHDTFDYVATELDPSFNYSLAVAQVAADLILQLGSLVVVPLNPVDYGTKLSAMLSQLQTNYGAQLDKAGVSTESLADCVRTFQKSAAEFVRYVALQTNIHSTHADTQLRLRALNDKLFTVDRGFLDFSGIPGRPEYRHVVFAPALHDSYSGSGFPGVTDAIFEASFTGGDWENVKKQISVLSLQILAAADILSQ